MSTQRCDFQGLIVPFKDLTSEELGVLPGKISRLHYQWRHGVNVPAEGFVIFPNFISEIVQSIISGQSIPKMAAEEIISCYKKCGFESGGVHVAVRGALSIEDQSNASWAGGSESPTNVLGEKSLLQSVEECIRLTFSGKMDGYRNRLQLSSEMKLSILIHQMAHTDAFATVFTVNPLNGKKDEILIQAVFGGGQLLTGGKETGDTYVMTRHGSLLRSTVEEKSFKVVSSGVQELDPTHRRKQVLSEDYLEALSRFVLQVEANEDGVAQDCEVAIEFDGNQAKFALIQCRPVTALCQSHEDFVKAVIVDAQEKAGKTLSDLRARELTPTFDVYSDQNIAEILTSHPTRFSFGLFTYIFAGCDGGIATGRRLMGYDIGTELRHGFFEPIGGQPRCSITKDALTYRIKGMPLTDYYQGFVLPYLEAIRLDTALANYPEISLYEQMPTMVSLIKRFGAQRGQEYFVAYQRFFATIQRLEDSFSEEFTREKEALINEYIAKDRSLSLEILGTRELVASIMDNLEFLRKSACVWFVIAARLHFFSYARVKQLVEAHTASENMQSILDRLTSGLNGDPTTRFNTDLLRFQRGEVSLSDVIEEYGHLGFKELEISQPRYRENSDAIVALARQQRTDVNVQRATHQTDYQDALKEMQKYLESESERERFTRDVEVVRTYTVLRERVKFNYLKIYDRIRQKLLLLEKRLGLHEGDLFHIDPRELDSLLTDLSVMKAEISCRKIQRDMEAQVEVPGVILTDNLSSIGVPDIPSGAKILRGIGVTSYIIEGRAVIVDDPQDVAVINALHEGDVIVTATTDPGWAGVLGAIGRGGLVTEVGGPTAHGAITARELRLAGVLNVKHARKLIKTGQRVRVDGPAQCVYILD